MEEKTIIALEIGSSKIKGATGSITPDGALNVRAVEEEPISDIVRYGCIRNVVETAQAVHNVINRLELRETPRKIEGVYISLGGRSLSAKKIEIDRRLPYESIISEEVIHDITTEAFATGINERTIVSVTPLEILVDNKVTPKPIGVMGTEITAKLNLVNCRSQLLRNLTVVLEDRLGLKIMDTFVRPLALADLVLLNEEKKLGCMLVDFGAETTTVAIYKGGALCHLAVLPMGSRNITLDITTLNYLEEQAEELKRKGGSAFPTMESTHAVGQPDYVAINNYVSARAGEIIINIIEQIKYAGLTPDKLPEGIVIVGKGSRLTGFNQRLEQLSGMKVRTGVPDNRLRILDGRIQVADSVDVLAVLNQAARHNPKECMSALPEPEQPRVQVSKPQQTPAQQPAAMVNEAPVNAPKVTSQNVVQPRPQVAVKQPAQTEPAEPKGPNMFVRGYKNLVDRVAKIISDGFEEEEDE